MALRTSSSLVNFENFFAPSFSKKHLDHFHFETIFFHTMARLDQAIHEGRVDNGIRRYRVRVFSCQTDVPTMAGGCSFCGGLGRKKVEKDARSAARGQQDALQKRGGEVNG